MDWLLVNHIMINYSKKFHYVSLMPIELIKSVYLFLNSIELGSCKTENQGYVLLLASEVELEQVLDKIAIVREYPNVFLVTSPIFV